MWNLTHPPGGAPVGKRPRPSSIVRKQQFHLRQKAGSDARLPSKKPQKKCPVPNWLPNWFPSGWSLSDTALLSVAINLDAAAAAELDDILHIKGDKRGTAPRFPVPPADWFWA